MLKNYINDVLLKCPLTDHDLRKHGIKHIIPYDDLKSYDSLEDLPLEDGCIILYQLESENNGHWTCMYLDKDIPCYFDPYGKKPDHWLFEKGAYNDTDAYLSQLILRHNGPVNYNSHQYQKLNGNIATCGRWCILRLLYKLLTNEEFLQCFSKKVTLDPDELVSLII